MNPARRGFSFTELIVVLAILGLIGSTIGLTMVRQQRFYRGTTEILSARQRVRDAMEVLSTDIRGVSAADTLRLLADSAIELFSNIGTSIVCRSFGAGDVGLPASNSPGNTFSAFLAQPDTGDLALFYRESSDAGEPWERHRISGFSSSSLASSCPPSSGFSQQADLDTGAKGFLVSLTDPLSAAVKPGAPVRFVRRGRHSLYRAADGAWYLGYRRCNAMGASVCGAIQPLSGPYRAYSTNPRATGLLLEYFDRLGRRVDPASPLTVARVDITARSESPQRILVEGRAKAFADSAAISVAIRNRAR